MAHELTHVEASELLGVYALDALDADERDAVEAHLVGCGFCRTEVQEHTEMAGLLSTGVFGVPMSVWDRISGELEGTATAPPLDLAPIHALRPSSPSPVDGPGPIRPAADRPQPAPRRGLALRVGALVAAATVAASVIGVLGLKVVQDGRQIDAITAGAHQDEFVRTVNAARADPQVVKVEMRSPDGVVFADAWMLPDGRGYLDRHNLPTLGDDRNYQLWAVVDGNKISVGLLGSGPQPSAFVANGAVAALAITEEAAGGVVVSLEQPVVVGEVRKF